MAELIVPPNRLVIHRQRRLPINPRAAPSLTEDMFSKYGYVGDKASFLFSNYMVPSSCKTIMCAFGCGFYSAAEAIFWIRDVIPNFKTNAFHYSGCPASIDNEDYGCEKEDGYANCCICLQNDVDIAFGGCGHAVTCFSCVKSLWTKKTMTCPTCRAAIFCVSGRISSIIAIKGMNSKTKCDSCYQDLTQIPGWLCTSVGCRNRSVLCESCEAVSNGWMCGECSTQLRKVFH